jgi:hypothetical protein
MSVTVVCRCAATLQSDEGDLPTTGGLQDFLPLKCGISATFVDITDSDAVAAAITDRFKAAVVA